MGDFILLLKKVRLQIPKIPVIAPLVKILGTLGAAYLPVVVAVKASAYNSIYPT